MKLTYDADTLSESDLADAVAGTGYDANLQATETDDEYELEGRLIVGGFFGMMTMLWYVLFLYPAYLGVDSSLLLFDPAGQAGDYLLWNMAVMTGVVVGYTGWPLLRGAYVSLRAGRPNMDLLVAMAAVTAFLYSVVAVILGHTEVYFDVATVIVMAVSVGDYYQDRVRRRALDRLTEFTTQRPIAPGDAPTVVTRRSRSATSARVTKSSSGPGIASRSTAPSWKGPLPSTSRS